MKDLGDYAILKQIGQGSLGSLYLGEHRFFRRLYALKVLEEELSSEPGFVERFEKEISHLATLDHPHLAKVDQVSHDAGRYFLVSEAADEAMNLEQYLEKHGQLPEQDVYQIACQIASALDYAHQKGGRPHLGIKLNNVLVAEGPKVTLTDFGLVRVMGLGTALNRLCKAHGKSSFLQSYAFLAPEQKTQDNPSLIGFKADIYAFGVLIYYIIMHEFPEGMFELPSERVKDYKLNWDRLIFCCLQKDPAKRPASLLEALEELDSKKTKETKSQQLKPVLKPQEIIRPEYEPDPGAIFQTESLIGRYQPEQVEAKEIEPILTEMFVVPGGTFLRGSAHGARDEMPRHAAQLSSFAIDTHPVTNDQFVRFLEAMGGEKDRNNNDIIRLRESRIKRSGGKLNIESGYTKHPVVGVTWYGAVAYAKWVGKRLPTEAEWEIAACGTLEECIYPTGADIERSQANFFSSDTTAVMSYPPNGYGLYDMAGNVYEWCQDWYDYHYYEMSIQEPDNPKGPLQGVYRVLRGGCWKSLKEDLRCAHRHRNNPGTMNGTYGFRCAADVE